jgi:thrombospondin type 3 repeat protein
MRNSGLIVGVVCAMTAWMNACSDYGSNQDYRPDRLTLAGTVCSDDPADRDYPVKIMFIVDSSPGMASLDPEGRRSAAVQDILNRFVASARYEFSIVHYGGRAIGLTDGYIKNMAQLSEAFAALHTTVACQGDSCRDWLGALNLARSTFMEDVASMHPAALSRARYIFLFVAGGPPQPTLETLGGCAESCRLSRVVESIADIAQQSEIADLEFNTVQLDDGPGVCLGTPDFRYCNSTNACPEDFECDDPNRIENDYTHELLGQLSAASDSDSARFSIAAQLNFHYLDLHVEYDALVPRTFLISNRNTKVHAGRVVADSDADGLSDQQELELMTDPARPDSDGDQLDDLLESLLKHSGLDPLRPDRPSVCTMDLPYLDSDADGLNDCEETVLGTDLLLQDTDRDGYPDGVELRAGTNPFEQDAEGDLDHDGIANGIELEVHLDPQTVDSNLESSLAYFYETFQDDARPIHQIGQPLMTTGVEVSALSEQSIAGAGTLYYYPAGTLNSQGVIRSQPALAWSDAADYSHGQEVTISANGSYLLFSECACQKTCPAGCSPGEWCDPFIGVCVPDPCELSVCTSLESCDHRTGHCLPDCNKAGCEQGMSCETYSGKCVEDKCARVTCNGSQECNVEAGICASSSCQEHQCPQDLAVDTSISPPWIVVEVDKQQLQENETWCDGSLELLSCETDADCPATSKCRSREILVVTAPEKTCIDFVVENISLAETMSEWQGTMLGNNRIQVMLGLHPEGDPDGHTVYRSAEVTVRYFDGRREPDTPVIWLSDQDFLPVPERP